VEIKMLGIESQIIAGLMDIFGGNIFLLGLFICGLLAGIVIMLRLPIIIAMPLFAFVFILLIGIPTVGSIVLLVAALVIGTIIAFFVARNVGI
jgi:hypothetical protein